MKNKLLYLAPVLLVLFSGCFKTSTNTPASTPTPSGTFTGQFRLLHRHTNNVPYDTTTANITLIMNTSGTYTVTGDTSTVHAGSYGNYVLNAQDILFNDKTFPKTGTPTKTHLNGEYLYYYDGSVFQMLAYSIDTLSLEYDLKKTQ